MQEYTVEGFRPYKITVRETGEVKEGVTVFCSYTDEHITGTGMEKFSISNDKLGVVSLKVGMLIAPIYNKYGKVDGISVL
ncbi:MAG: hypothetical protein GX488_11055 [Clostridiales bacterium]|nr:hypothetical protein [Clostridiales bacterium]